MFREINRISEDGGLYGKGVIHASSGFSQVADTPSGPLCGESAWNSTLHIDAMWQLLGFFLAWKGNQGRGRALGAKDIVIDDRTLSSSGELIYEINVKRIVKRDIVLGIADGTLSRGGRIGCRAEDLRVAVFP